MTPDKLRKYLAYYQKTLREEPDNIEARLRLAAIFRDMGRHAHAVDEYVSASKLLAREGLPLEAIAACKAVLKLEPGHTETQHYLARLFARAPDATDDTARIARPVQSARANRSGRAAGPRDDLAAGVSPASVSSTSAEQPITLSNPVASPTASATDVPERRTAQMAAYDHRHGFSQVNVSGVDAGSAADRPPLWPASDVHTELTRRKTTPLIDSRLADGRRNDTDRGLPPVGDAGRVHAESQPAGDRQETFEVGVFDMESLRLDGESSGHWDDLSFLDELDEPDTAEVAAVMASSVDSTMVHVKRSQIPEIPLFGKLDRSVFIDLLGAMDVHDVRAGTTIVKPGRAERSLFVIVRGTAVVTRPLDDGAAVQLAEMGEGEFFGEFALLTGRSGQATVSADTSMTLLEVSRELIDDLGVDYPNLWDILWDFYHARALNNMLASSRLFRSLTNDQRRELADQFTLREVPGEEMLAERGASDFDLHLICHGQVSIDHDDRPGDSLEHLETLGEGHFVGVSSSAHNQPLAADIQTTCDTTFLVLAGDQFRSLIDRHPPVERAVGRLTQHHFSGRFQADSAQ